MTLSRWITLILSAAFFLTGTSATQYALAQASADPFPILTSLLARNSAWAYNVTLHDPYFFPRSAEGQSPKVLWIGCADSRVPESVIMDVMPGVIFVHRNIANQVHSHDDSALSVISYAVHLGVEHIIVAGHTRCGGIITAHELSNTTTPPTTPLLRWLQPLVDLSRYLHLQNRTADYAVPILTNASVEQQVINVANSEAVQHAWKDGHKLYVHGWLYSLETGRLSDMKRTIGPPP